MHLSRTSRRVRLAALIGGTAMIAVMALPAAAQDSSAAPVVENPYAATGAVPGSGAGKKIGYISLGDSIPFVKLVSDSIAAEAAIAGADYFFCDSQLDDAKALDCALQMKTQDVQGVLNFQLYADISEQVCAAYDDLPTIAIDIHQVPCEVVFMGANNHFAGEVSGKAVAEALQAENGCTFDQVITLESPSVGEVNTQRVGGMIDGFQAVCGEIPAEKLVSLGPDGTTDKALELMSNHLPTVAPGSVIVVLSLNDDMALGALAAARTAGRDAELRIGAQGADPSAWAEIACNPVWVADAAYFPERYGKTLIPAMIDLLDGKEVPRELFTPHEAVNAGNVHALYPDAPACG